MNPVIKWIYLALPVPIAAIIFAIFHRAILGYYLDCLFLVLCVIIIISARPVWRNNSLPLSTEQFKEIARKDRQEEPYRNRLSTTLNTILVAIPTLISLAILHHI